jgi:hypothetical protein
MNISAKSSETCMMYTEDNWLVYQSHFLYVNFLTVQVLQTDKHKSALNMFTQTAIKIMNSYDHITSIKIKETFLSKNIKPRRLHFYNTTVRHGVLADSSPIGRKELIQMKSLISDAAEGYLIVAWHPKVLHQFLDQGYRIVVPKIRATYALQFIFSTEHLCKTVKIEMDNLLRRLWLEYNIVNVIAQSMCSCDTSKIYIFRPFIKTDNMWGLTEYYHFQEVVANFRVITNPLKNFNRFPLSISVFEMFPVATKRVPKLLRHNPIYNNLTWSHGFAGVDGIMLGTIAEYLNFDIVPFGTTTKENFGYLLPNGTSIGSLHDVIHRKVVVSANSRYVANYSSKVEFTIPYISSEICAVVPKALKLPNWAILLTCFDLPSWICIILSVTASALFWYQMAPSKDFIQQAWEIFSFLVGIPTRIVPVLHHIFFLVGCMVFSIVILGTIQGFLFTSFTKTIYNKDVNTLEEVDQLGLPTASVSWGMMSNDSDIVRRLKEKRIDPTPNMFDLVAYQRNLVVFDSKILLQFLSKTKYTDDDGQPLLHIVDECPGTFMIARIVPEGSAFLNVFNNIIVKNFENGLSWKWIRDLDDSILTEKLMKRKKNKTSVRSFSLHDSQSAFYVIIFGHACAVLVFFCEILTKREKKAF